uniref:NADH-ubiquinone oxidoreductase chain 6 n=1 Tax=Pselaphinae sp. 12 EF-2015 TaxID=1756871 RepID=A0A0S2M8F4_9COLE|nr:NADH deshydrogenase subunit 6 [Pselaphinae sp. 12 EF-2015]
MLLLLIMNLIMTLSMLFMKHPLSLGLILLMQTINVSLISGLLSNFWFSYILFLIFIGGMLILFMYMISIASNDMFFLNKILLIAIIFILMITLSIFMNFDLYILNLFTMMENYFMNYMINSFLLKFFNYPNKYILIILMIYLFITLIVCVKISNTSFGPMRQKYENSNFF